MEQVVDLMLLPERYAFDFHPAEWETLKQKRPKLHELLARGAADEEAARSRYHSLMENGAMTLAALLNITTAMSTINLPAGTPMTYLKELILDGMMQQDRFFAYADKALVD